MSDETVMELRLRYSAEGMTTLIALLDSMKLGALPDPVALFLAHASNPVNWHNIGSNLCPL